MKYEKMSKFKEEDIINTNRLTKNIIDSKNIYDA